MKHNKKLPGIIVLIILTLITVICWIGFSIYRALTTRPPIEVSEAVLQSLDPNLNQEYLERLPTRLYIDNLATGTTQITTIEEALPSPESTPLATDSASPAPDASSSATPEASATPTP